VKQPLVVLGATGSIGRQTLDVASRLGIDVQGMAARRGSDDLVALAGDWPGARIVATAPSGEERDRLSGLLRDRVEFGSEALEALASRPGVTVVNGVVGAAGLRASIAALEAGNRLALANKESLVAGGPVVLRALQRGGGSLLPVDSEHSALFQCLVGESTAAVRRLVLTASGGPFRGYSIADLEKVTPAQALAHPTWKMGRRITVDSATLFNKGLEVIEAHYLFDMPYDRIEVVVHPQSIVHSLVEFVDGSLKAHVGEPDMRVPIQYAITYPDRAPGGLGAFDFSGRSLTFDHPDRRSFPALDLAYEAGRIGRSAPAVLNAADEVAVHAFLDGRLGFLGIPEVVERTLEEVPVVDLVTVDDVVEVDREARAVAHSLLGGSC
jgi:1-deoxy-D-xylulose-5-phosphate reductoisomerase